jgi:hypothetical protein
MGVVIRGLRPALALFVIAHGLAHAVLPLRGSIDPAVFERDFMPWILYTLAVLGFTTAGIGLLGVTPFTAVVRPSLVLASGYSLIAILTSGTRGLGWGLAVDVVLLVTGLSGLYRYLPSVRRHAGLPHRVALSVGIAFVLYVGCAVVLWPVHRVWGSQSTEYALTFPGDRIDRNPALQIQHAVTVDAAPEAVWPWLMQLGQDRGGFYSYDWLERAFGVDIHNTEEIRPDWQTRQIGELSARRSPTTSTASSAITRGGA